MSASLRTIAGDEGDIRLDRWFRRHFPGLTQGAIEKFCRTGQVRVDGRRAEASTRLVAGQSVRIPPLGLAPPAPRTADPVAAATLARITLYEDEHLLVLDKPAGLPTQGGPGITRHVDALLATAGATRLRLVHRLDRDTSGVLVVARTPAAAARLAAAFRGRDVEKTYWAVVVGRPVPVSGRITAPLVRLEQARADRVALAIEGEAGAARALTDYETLDHAGRRLAWLALRPLTGRTHQLRVHCAAIGAPILGDTAYGAPALDGFAQQLHLHARQLDLPHPAGGRLIVEAALSPHMLATFRRLGFTAPPPKPPQRLR